MTIPYGSLAVTVDVGTVVATAAHALGTPAEALTGVARGDGPTIAHRHIAMAAARQLGHSLPAIGRAFGRDHTTVLHACRRVADTPALAERARAIADEATTPRSLF